MITETIYSPTLEELKIEKVNYLGKYPTNGYGTYTLGHPEKTIDGYCLRMKRALTCN